MVRPRLLAGGNLNEINASQRTTVVCVDSCAASLGVRTSPLITVSVNNSLSARLVPVLPQPLPRNGSTRNPCHACCRQPVPLSQIPPHHLRPTHQRPRLNQQQAIAAEIDGRAHAGIAQPKLNASSTHDRASDGMRWQPKLVGEGVSMDDLLRGICHRDQS